jgi:hypothetical protein
MEIFLERLLLEVAAIAVQLAIMRIVAWVRDRSSPATTFAAVVAA